VVYTLIVWTGFRKLKRGISGKKLDT